MSQLDGTLRQIPNGSVESFLQAVSITYTSAPLRHQIAIAFGIILVARFISQGFRQGVKAPYVGYRSIFEPAFLVRLRFSKGALPQITEGYQKFKTSMFKVSRNDRDLVVISNKYVDELRNLPEEKLSSIQALITNICGPYTASEIMLEGNLHTRVLQTKLTPNLASLTAIMKDETRLAIRTIVPECEDHWAEVHIHELIGTIISQISNRIFLGEPDCRNQEWCSAAIAYTENVTLTIMLIRCFPSWLRPLASWFLPSTWRVHSNLRRAKRALVPVILRRRAQEKSEAYGKPNDVLQWMMEAANADEGHPEKLAHRMLILILASVHTTTMAGTHAFYDLCANPEYYEPLRAEIETVTKLDSGWGKTTLTKMRKMDSFLKESQRINPASLLGMHRIVQTPLTLSDGTYLPSGTHLCVASHAISKDPSFASNADSFDGFRYYRKRQAADEENKHQFAMTDKNHLHFGHGKYACPGRFFASNELKIVVAELIMEFDFKYPEGLGRPPNLNADEFLYSDPRTVLLVRRRQG